MYGRLISSLKLEACYFRVVISGDEMLCTALYHIKSTRRMNRSIANAHFRLTPSPFAR